MPNTTPSISNEVIQLSGLSSKLLESPQSVETKIEIIKQEIRSGHYQINPECIAMHLMAVSSTVLKAETA